MFLMFPPVTLRRARRLKVHAPRGGVRGKDAPPDLRPALLVRERKVHDEPKAPHEGLVERPLHVRGEYREAAIGLHPLQKVADLDVRVAVVAVLHLAPLAEEGVSLVEEQDGASVLRRVEDLPQVLLCLADVLADRRRKVYPEEVQASVLRPAPPRPLSCPSRCFRRRGR